MLSIFSRFLNSNARKLENKKNTLALIESIKEKIEYIASLKRSDPEQSQKMREAHLATLDHLIKTSATPVELYDFAISLHGMAEQEYAVAEAAYDSMIIKLQEDIKKSLTKFENVEFDFSEVENKEEPGSLPNTPSDLMDFTCTFNEKNNNTTPQTSSQDTVPTIIKKSFHRQYTKESQYSGFFTRVEDEEKPSEPVYLEERELETFRIGQNGL